MIICDILLVDKQVILITGFIVRSVCKDVQFETFKLLEVGVTSKWTTVRLACAVCQLSSNRLSIQTLVSSKQGFHSQISRVYMCLQSIIKSSAQSTTRRRNCTNCYSFLHQVQQWNRWYTKLPQTSSYSSALSLWFRTGHIHRILWFLTNRSRT